MNKEIIGIIGAGAMGSGIAQVAASSGHSVILFDANSEALNKAESNLLNTLKKLAEKNKISEQDIPSIFSRITFAKSLQEMASCQLIIEAVIENLSVKKEIFSTLENIVESTCILATNTSSLSVTSIASACKFSNRIIGIHFFNPAPLMPLVEIVPALQTQIETVIKSKKIIADWNKTVVLAKDTPGFIVNRIARPFYGEAMRIYEEGIADIWTIDWAMKEIGGFRMGPFELMDFIGHDVNYTVTETVFKDFFYDPRYKPSFTQKRLVEAGWLGKKSGKGFYDYSDSAVKQQPHKDKKLAEQIVNRILIMLINEAVDALYLQIASKEDIELAMTKGVNYPKGLLKWADDLGIENCVAQLRELYNTYQEDRYRCSPLLMNMQKEQKTFYN
ncbi:MAG: NAD(P)-binding domain-containing protein [Flavobacteriales bacterium]|nr:NAD(P)-binding domain-containing protein [Flavobacteriales bacterium]